jgi:hypothetical protein
LGCFVPSVHPILNRFKKDPLSLFSVSLESIECSHNIFKLSKLLNSIITVEKPKKSRFPPQCMICESYVFTRLTSDTSFAVSIQRVSSHCGLYKVPWIYPRIVPELIRKIIRAALLTKNSSSFKIWNNPLSKLPTMILQKIYFQVPRQFRFQSLNSLPKTSRMLNKRKMK